MIFPRSAIALECPSPNTSPRVDTHRTWVPSHLELLGIDVGIQIMLFTATDSQEAQILKQKWNVVDKKLRKLQGFTVDTMHKFTIEWGNQLITIEPDGIQLIWLM